MKSYAYHAALYCDECAREIIDDLDRQGIADDGTTDNYPQPVLGSDEADSPQHCDNCQAFLENDLTPDGVEYVREALARSSSDSVAWTIWRPFYRINPLIDYELCDLGIDYPDYFQGFGTTFTRYQLAVVGCGDNPREAIADALEQIACAGEGYCQLSADDLARQIAEDEGWQIDDRGEVLAPDSPNLAEEDADEPESDYGARQYYIGIRWNPIRHWRSRD